MTTVNCGNARCWYCNKQDKCGLDAINVGPDGMCLSQREGPGGGSGGTVPPDLLATH